MVPASVHEKYEVTRRVVEIVGRRVENSVYEFCRSEGFAFSLRYKTPESIAEKIETGRFTSWSQLDDLFACTVVIPTLLHEPHVLQFLESAFLKRSVRARGASAKAPDVFRFDATRFYGTLRPVADPDMPPELWQQVFEVQVRTAFEHAWSVTTHDLTFKGRDVDWRRLRLVAQLKAAVEQLDLLVVGFNEASSHLAPHRWEEVETKGLIIERFKFLVDSGAIPAELGPKDWARFAANLYSMILSGSDAPRRPKDAFSYVQRCLDAIAQTVSSSSPDLIPRSLSLIQYCFATLVEQHLLAAPLRQYVPLITGELMSLYPETREMADSSFRLDT